MVLGYGIAVVKMEQPDEPFDQCFHLAQDRIRNMDVEKRVREYRTNPVETEKIQTLGVLIPFFYPEVKKKVVDNFLDFAYNAEESTVVQLMNRVKKSFASAEK